MLKRHWYSLDEAAELLKIPQREVRGLLLQRELGGCVVAPFGDPDKDWHGRWKLGDALTPHILDFSTRHLAYEMELYEMRSEGRPNMLPDETMRLYGLWRLPRHSVSNLFSGQRYVEIGAIVPEHPEYYWDQSSDSWKAGMVVVEPTEKRSRFGRRHLLNKTATLDDVVISSVDIERYAPTTLSVDNNDINRSDESDFVITPLDCEEDNSVSSGNQGPRNAKLNRLYRLFGSLVLLNEQPLNKPEAFYRWIARHENLKPLSPLPEKDAIIGILSSARTIYELDH